MPKKLDQDNDFTKASIKKDAKEALKQIAADEKLYEYELIEKLLKEKYPSYFPEEEITA